jgi:RNA polymerase sigma factor (sigma-70 family)
LDFFLARIADADCLMDTQEIIVFLNAAIAGGEMSKSALLELLSPWLLQLAQKMMPRKLQQIAEPEDFVQEARINIYLNLNRFIPRSPDCAIEFLAWCKTILRNEIGRVNRKSVNRLRRPTEGVDAADMAYASTHDRDMQQEELRVLLNRNLETVSPFARAALILYGYEGLTYAEIGDILVSSGATVNGQLQRARKRLRKTMLPSWED